MVKGIRKILEMLFAFTSIAVLSIGVRRLFINGQRFHTLLTLRHITVPAIFVTMCLVFGAASWTGWKNKHSSKYWGLAASIILFACPILLVVLFSQRIRLTLLATCVLGSLGIVAFVWPDKSNQADGPVIGGKEQP